MTSASISIGDKTIKTEKLPININVLSSTIGDFALIRFMEKTYRISVMPNGLQMTGINNKPNPQGE